MKTTTFMIRSAVIAVSAAMLSGCFSLVKTPEPLAPAPVQQVTLGTLESGSSTDPLEVTYGYAQFAGIEDKDIRSGETPSFRSMRADSKDALEVVEVRVPSKGRIAYISSYRTALSGVCQRRNGKWDGRRWCHDAKTGLPLFRADARWVKVGNKLSLTLQTEDSISMKEVTNSKSAWRAHCNRMKNLGKKTEESEQLEKDLAAALGGIQ